MLVQFRRAPGVLANLALSSAAQLAATGFRMRFTFFRSVICVCWGGGCSVLQPLLPCGHQPTLLCHNVTSTPLPDIKCPERVLVRLRCGHTRSAACSQVKEMRSSGVELDCTFTQVVQLACSHRVTQRCNTVPKCGEQCSQKLPCGHPCSQKCVTAPPHTHNVEDCTKPCTKILTCGHKCVERCGQPHTTLCQKPCMAKCPHKACSKRCWEVCDRAPCTEQCGKRLTCGHMCKGMSYVWGTACASYRTCIACSHAISFYCVCLQGCAASPASRVACASRRPSAGTTLLYR